MQKKMDKILAVLKDYGITNVAGLNYNLSYDELFEHEINPQNEGYSQGTLTDRDAVAVDTGIFTGRSPKDKYIVEEETSKHNIWWRNELRTSSDNKPLSEKNWEYLYDLSAGQLSGKNLYVQDGYAGANKNTRIRLANECTSRYWIDSNSKQADIIIGAPGNYHAQDGYAIRTLTDLDICFAVAATHPLARLSEHIKCNDVLEHRLVIVSDSLHEFPAGTPDIFLGRDVLSVPDLQSKYETIRLGLGVGYLPAYMIERDIDAGHLVPKNLEELQATHPLTVQWRTNNPGKTLEWFLESLGNPEVIDQILEPPVS